MNLDERKIIYDDDNLEFENFESQVPVPHNVFPNLATSNTFANGFVGLTAPPMNTTPLIPVDIKQLIGDEAANLESPAEENTEVLKQYNKKKEIKTNTKNDNKSTNVTCECQIKPQEILREYDLSLEVNDDYLKRGSSVKKINEIFSYLEDSDGNILNALNAYRVPYPISKALVKKIISISVDYIDKEWFLCIYLEKNQ